MAHRSIYIIMGTFLAVTCLFCAFFMPFRAEAVSADSMLENGYTVNAKMRYLSDGVDLVNRKQPSNIKAIRMSDSLPDGFVPSSINTVSTANSKYPTYIFFDNQDEAGILYFYTENGKIVMNPDSSYLFADLSALTDISGLAEWDTSSVTNMNSMFCNCKGLPDALALRYWDTSNVTNMDYMFSGASLLMYIDVSRWNTGKVTSMVCMFQVGDSYLANGELIEIVGLENLDVSNVTDMTCMFYGAGKMTQYNIADWDVSKVTSMNHMFCDNRSLRSLDLSSWDVSNVRTIYCMFDDNCALKTIGDVSHWNTASLVDAGGWLNNSYHFVGDNFGVLDLSGWDTSNLKAVGEMFLHTQIHTLDLSGWTFASITNDSWKGAGRGIFYEFGNMSEGVKGFGKMFKDSPSLETVYVSESGLATFHSAVENGVNTEEMWLNASCDGFTVKQQSEEK